MSGSKFYVAWVISRFIIITGMISIATSTILWIGAVRGITAYSKHIVYDNAYIVLLLSSLIGLFIVGCGFLLIYLRKKIFDSNHSTRNTDVSIIKEMFNSKPYRPMGLWGGFITIGGVIWLASLIITTIYGQNRERFCDTYPDGQGCYHNTFNTGFSDDNFVEAVQESPAFNSTALVLFILPILVGQILVLLPHVSFGKRLSDHA